ncbi:hypothetical protein SAMN04488511_11968 [Pedobacter suwonensis]|uniref:TerB family tellurite resistance protein n=2 Tax=Pedobacter suwonensis TaxID=332999 RepID=A0A1I0U345_9SPHI|nr:hypothetical protein SAMN04488511_11968 [Pedobacter suwonensis]
MLFIGTGQGYSQTWNELFRQKKTQKKYLLQQIAALEVYTGYLKKGYEIASSGLHTIRDLSNGEFSLHNAFITGLKKVSPVVRNNVRVAEIIEMQIAIGKAFGNVRSNVHLSLSNQLYVQEVRDNLWEECLKDLEELLLVIISGKLEMDDAQRLKRLDKIYLSMREKSSFTEHFTTEVEQLILQKQLEKSDTEQLRRNYEVHE